MATKAIYRIDPATGTREPAYARSNGSYQLIDLRVPFAFGDEPNFRNLARVSVAAKNLDEAAMLVGLGYGIRVLSAKGKPNYAYDVVVES